jgi:hypothetical protein
VPAMAASTAVKLRRPVTRTTYRVRRAAACADGGVLLSPQPLTGHDVLGRLSTRVVDVASHVGVSPVLVQTAFATLADNALVHGRSDRLPIVAISLSEEFLSVNARDFGQTISGSADAVVALGRLRSACGRGDARPGAAAGLAWLTELLLERSDRSELVFAAGNGLLFWRKGEWASHRIEVVSGLMAIARIAL